MARELLPLRLGFLCLSQQIVHGSGQAHQVIVAFGMVGKRHKDVVPLWANNDRRIVPPVFPSAGLAKNDAVASREAFHKLAVEVGNVRGGEDVFHDSRCLRRDQTTLLEEEIESE